MSFAAPKAGGGTLCGLPAQGPGESPGTAKPGTRPGLKCVMMPENGGITPRSFS